MLTPTLLPPTNGIIVTCPDCGEPIDQAALEWMHPITTRDGLLFRNGVQIPLPEADEVARAHGHQYAERFVRALESKGK